MFPSWFLKVAPKGSRGRTALVSKLEGVAVYAFFMPTDIDVSTNLQIVLPRMKRKDFVAANLSCTLTAGRV